MWQHFQVHCSPLLPPPGGGSAVANRPRRLIFERAKNLRRGRFFVSIATEANSQAHATGYR
ncbi:hypothetical protein HMPREF0758_0758 [Serratia odorifera DSM 4582]|uniref:Uncharacterized protein n=1 Tax=Serratia odorifera DSM 4582 TaxID=667129 RepID=D4DXX5_SEROD|nr:hypothetical protein HMPREF0758_0758 [Serratia odorifera DSM 4582]